MNTVITIAREFGSGGRELGKRLADLLGFAYYDHEIIKAISERTKLSEEYIHSIVEHKPLVAFPIHIGMSFQPIEPMVMNQNNAIFTEQCNILREMADKSDCIIVGRCGDAILADKHPFRIFVYADIDSRIERCRAKASEEEKNMSDKALRKHILDIDRQRAKYYNFYTDKTWGDRLNYDLCVNTTNANIKEVSAFIAELIKKGIDKKQ